MHRPGVAEVAKGFNSLAPGFLVNIAIEIKNLDS
jgi:hypothetical protein